MNAETRGEVDQRMANVIAVTDVGELETAERAVMLRISAYKGGFPVKRFVIAAIAAGALAFPAIAALKAGDKAPDFKTKASLAGKTFDFSLAKALKKGPVVVYFYPAAFTGGCNVQAHTFAENQPKFAAAKATIIGVSGDSIQRLNDFSADPQYCAGKFPVASDPDGAIGRSFNLTVRAREGAPTYKDSRGQLLDIGYNVDNLESAYDRASRWAWNRQMAQRGLVGAFTQDLIPSD